MKILLDTTSYTQKPSGKEIGKISTRIVNNVYESKNIREAAELIGNHGHTWCPAIFNNKRRIEDFKELQLIALDFDGNISFEEINTKAEKYMIPILFAYETFSSINKNKFRVVFMLNEVIYEKESFDTIISMMMKIFEGCDTSCKDISRMFFGGKNLFFYNEKHLKVNFNTLKMNFELYMKDTYGNTHYQKQLKNFYGKNSPSPLIYKNGNGEKLRNHKQYRSDTLSKLDECCQLYHEFITDSEWLYYKDLFGLAVNLIHVEGGTSMFKKTIADSEYDTYKRDWNFYLKYMKKNGYAPMNCNKFCPYSDSCPHSTNMLSTAKLKRNEIIRTVKPEYSSIEDVYSDLENNFYKAITANDKNIHLIKAQTAIGKTHMYLDYLSRTDTPCLVAVPTNILKKDVYNRCIENGINARMTPSIDDIKNAIPKNVYNRICQLYDYGKHNQVYPYISEILKSEDVPALRKFLEERKTLKNFKGHIITTHHRVLFSDKEWLKQYQIIIDEDILKTMICNQETVMISDIEELLEKNLPLNVCSKLNSIIEKSESEKYFKIDKAKIKKSIDACFNINALLKAKKFYSDGEKVVFYKTPKLKKIKYIVLSATADPFIYENYFGKDRVQFYECKQARYTGTLKQYYNGSYSRSYIDSNDDVWNRIKEITDNATAITFKKYSSGCEIHFGNSEGCNFLGGENIAVVGTPHMNECVYKLMSYQMNGDTEAVSHYRQIEHNGFKFWFHTYSDELLRRIQLWLIESELEQCVGRARLLRNDCIVYLFSNFLLEQSKFVE